MSTPITGSPYDYRKATEIIVYLTQNRADKPSAAHLYALHLAADMKHIEQYGSFINRDNTYTATQDTLAPGVVYQMIQNGSCAAFDVIGAGLDAQIISWRKADLGEFSQSDLHCLEEAMYESEDMPKALLLGRVREMWEIVTGNGHTFRQFDRLDSSISAGQMVGGLPNVEILRQNLRLQ